MVRSYTHLDIRNALVSSAAKQLTTLPHPIIKICATVKIHAFWNLKQGSLKQKMLS